MGDEIVALGGCRVAEMNYEQFKGRMDTAQQKGTLLMDIRRHGQNGEDVEPVCENEALLKEYSTQFALTLLTLGSSKCILS